MTSAKTERLIFKLYNADTYGAAVRWSYGTPIRASTWIQGRESYYGGLTSALQIYRLYYFTLQISPQNGISP
jgi:hypothetical protein